MILFLLLLLQDPAQTLDAHKGTVSALAVSPDGKKLASGGADGKIHIWNLADGKRIESLGGHDEKVTLLRFHKNSTLLASASTDKLVKIWDVEQGSRIHTLKGHSSRISHLQFSSDGKSLASIAVAGVFWWDARKGKRKHSYFLARPTGGGGPNITASAITPNHKTIAWAFDIGQVDIVTAGKRVKSHELQLGSNLRSIAMTTDGKLIAAGGGSTIRAWSLTNGKQTVECKADGVTQLIFSPDRKRLVSVGDKGVSVWDAGTGKELRRIETKATAIAGDRRAKVILSGDAGGKIHIWK